jgi:hypothetical protein
MLTRSTCNGDVSHSQAIAAYKRLRCDSRTSISDKSPTPLLNSADTKISRFLGSGRITCNPHLIRRWPFGRVTEGLPSNGPEPAIYLQPVWISASACSRRLRSEVAEARTFRRFDFSADTIHTMAKVINRITLLKIGWSQIEFDGIKADSTLGCE